MSIHVMSKVWKEYPRGGSELLALLALADWSDDTGRCWPSVAAIARKIRLGEKQARRVIHSIIESGYLKVIENEQGGATSRRYKIQLDRLSPPTNGAPPVSGSTPADVLNPSHEREASAPADGSRNVIDTSGGNSSGVAQARRASSDNSAKEKITLQEFLIACKGAGESAIPHMDPIHDYADRVGISNEMLAVAWNEFKAAFLPTRKQQTDWRAHFRNAVRRNWYKLWYLREGELAQWTTAGEQARREAA